MNYPSVIGAILGFISAGLGIPVATAYSANEGRMPNVEQVSTVFSCVLGTSSGITSMLDCDSSVKRNFPNIGSVGLPKVLITHPS